MSVKTPFIFLLLLLPLSTFSQQNISIQLADLQKAKNDTAKVSRYLSIIKYYQYIKPDSATYYANQGLELARELKYRKGEGIMTHRLGAINESHGNLLLAGKYLSQAIGIFREIDFKEGEASCLNGIGVVEAKKGNLDTANEYFLRALKLNKSINNPIGIVQSYIKLGSVNESFNNLDKALEYFKAAEEINNTLPISDAYFTLCNNFGIVYAQKGDLKQAIQYFKRGVEKSDSAIFAGVHVSLLVNIGNAYDHLNNKEAAKIYLEKALEKARQYDLPEDEARTLMNISSMINTKNPQEANRYLDSALSLAIRIAHKKMEADIYQTFADNYEEQGRYKEAYTSLNKYYLIRDSLYDSDRAREIANLQANFELEESKVQIQDLKLSNQERTFERNISIAIISAILTVLITLWFALRRTHLLNKKLKESNQVKDKLFSIIGHDLKGPMAGISQMLGMMETEEFSAEEQQQIHEELRKQSEASLEILNSLLNWGNIQLQGIRVNAVAFPAKTETDKAIALLKNQAELKKITIQNDIPDNISVHADPDHFDFVMRNLLSNAIKFTHFSGNVTIDAVKHTEGEIVFSVCDNGIGISNDRQKYFFRDNLNVSFGTNGEKGTGLGLLLSKEFVQSNNGKIWFESEEGKGTTFYFSLKGA